MSTKSRESMDGEIVNWGMSELRRKYNKLNRTYFGTNGILDTNVLPHGSSRFEAELGELKEHIETLYYFFKKSQEDNFPEQE